jgi:hypothetical protein
VGIKTGRKIIRSVSRFLKQKTWGKDLYLGLTLIAFCLLLLFWIIPTYVGEQTTGQRGLTPRFFPYCITITLASMSILLIYNSQRISQGEASRAEDKRLTPFTIICTVLFLAYYIGVKVIGMVPTSALVLFTLVRLFGFRNWVFNILISAVFAILLFLFFEKMAQVSVPRGIVFEGLY